MNLVRWRATLILEAMQNLITLIENMIKLQEHENVNSQLLVWINTRVGIVVVGHRVVSAMKSWRKTIQACGT